MKFNIVRLDRRMNGYGHWSHRLDFSNGLGYDAYRMGMDDIHEVRLWLWENYGPGAELFTARRNRLPWAWDTDKGYRRIYVSKEILTVIQLKFG